MRLGSVCLATDICTRKTVSASGASASSNIVIGHTNGRRCPTAIFQAQAHNPLLGGVQRTYTRSEAAFIDSAVLRTLLAADLALMELTVGPRDWLVTCHQFRILCDERNAGHATPEGRHRDGHDFVFQHLIQRQQVTGEKAGYLRKKATVYSVQL